MIASSTLKAVYQSAPDIVTRHKCIDVRIRGARVAIIDTKLTDSPRRTHGYVQLLILDNKISYAVGMALTLRSNIENNECELDGKYIEPINTMFKDYAMWYKIYAENYARGFITLTDKPPLTLNAYVLIKHVGSAVFNTFDQLNYVMEQHDGHWRYINVAHPATQQRDSLIDRPTYRADSAVIPYVREYSKLCGVLTVHSVYDPADEHAEWQPVAHMVASDIHFAMLECEAFTDIIFE